MENEQGSPQPLTDEEIKNGIAHKVSQAVRAKLDTYGPIFGKSYPKFRCTGKLGLILDNFGLVTESNHAIDSGDHMDTFESPQVVPVDIDIPETPPNRFRRETEQAVPTTVIENGKPVERAILYKAKKAPRGER